MPSLSQSRDGSDFSPKQVFPDLFLVRFREATKTTRPRSIDASIFTRSEFRHLRRAAEKTSEMSPNFVSSIWWGPKADRREGMREVGLVFTWKAGISAEVLFSLMVITCLRVCFRPVQKVRIMENFV